MFDTLKYTRLLEAAGIAREQAEAHVRIIAEIIEGDLATRSDIQKLSLDLDNKLLQLEYRIVTKMGALLTAVTATAVAILKLT